MLVRRLKAETASLHRDVESVVRVLADDFSAGDYRAYLGALYGFIEPLERRLATRTDWPEGFDLIERLKTPLLAVDLHTLGVERDMLPRCANPPRVDTLSRALGALYVTEQSTLGGQLIERQLAVRLPEVALASAYVSSYGARTGSMWRAMAQVIEHAPSPDEAVEAACDTFRALTTWLTSKQGVSS